MITLHDRAMRSVASRVNGKINRLERLFNPEGMQKEFIPDVIGREGDFVASTHEVEVLNHKLTEQYLNDFLGAIRVSARIKRRPYAVLWFVIPNFERALKVFDEVRILGEGKRGFVSVFSHKAGLRGNWRPEKE